MIATAQCEHCLGGFEVEAEAEQAECPHCKQTSRILAVRVSAPQAAPRVLPKPSLTMPRQMSAEAGLIESKLDSIGRIFFIAGVIGAIICGFLLLIIPISSQSGKIDGGEAAGLIVSGIISFGQGVILQILFRALAEIIRLLRKTKENRTA